MFAVSIMKNHPLCKNPMGCIVSQPSNKLTTRRVEGSLSVGLLVQLTSGT